MNRTVIATAAGILFSWHGHTWAATTASDASAGWGNAPRPQETLRLAPSAAPRVAPAARAPADAPMKHGARGAKQAHHEAQASTPGCTNLPAKWDKANALATAGNTADAYAAYLALLHTCSDPGALAGTAWRAAQALPGADVDRMLADPVFDTPSLHKVRNDLRLQRLYAENEAGHYDSALAASRALRADPSVELDASALQVSGWLEDRAHDDHAAEQLFREAVKRGGDTSSAQLGLAVALMHQQRLAEAEAASRDLTTHDGRRLHAFIALSLAKDSGDAAQVDAALKLAEAAGNANEPGTRALAGWAMLNSRRPAQAQQIFAQLHAEAPDNEEYAQGLAYSASANRDYGTLDALAAAAGTSGTSGLTAQPSSAASRLARQTLAEHDEHRGLYDRARALTGHPSEAEEPAVQTAFTLDRKTGAPGQDKLTIWTIPQLSVKLLPTPSLSVQIDAAAMRLDNGVQHAWGKQLGATVRTEIGDGVLTAGAAIEAPGNGPVQVPAKIQYLRISEGEDEFVRIAASRDSVYDSLRAYQGSAGTGPAVSSSVEIAARQSIARSAFYVGETLSGGAVTASGTPFNPFYAASLSLTRDFRLNGWSWLNAGPEVRIGSYRYDANRYSGAYAGYWSPKSNREAGLVFFAQSDEGGRFLFKTGARVGYATRELYTGRASGAFGENTTTMAGLVSPWLIAGTGIGYRTSPGYHDVSVFAWLKIPFEPRGHLRAADLFTPRGF
ncbi:tetratricopeptide repeat protein [Paraburkholderia kururiensis]|uniref:Uncharacterized protein n=1 Tax=Paraburkholderia kururiensis TaxID=984307 RepID=A0ABZ0WHV8_9BURK|nr:hypothetical protein [Paraburkholderia kururiensis]WQD76942.1 hypothetical protein U0042_23145 [Paraburkholderia kururiensis]